MFAIPRCLRPRALMCCILGKTHGIRTEQHSARRSYLSGVDGARSAGGLAKGPSLGSDVGE